MPSIAASVRTFSVLVALSMCAAPALAAAADAQVLVVPIHGKAGAAFDAGVVRLIERPLQRHAGVIPPAAAKAAMKRARIRASGLHVARNVQKLGRAAGATYVLVIEATGRKPRLAANTTLIEVESGRTVFSDRYAMPGGKLSADVAAQILSPLVDKLGASGSDAPAADANADNPEDAPAKPAKGGKGKFAWPNKSTGNDSQDPTEPSASKSADSADSDSSASDDTKASEDGVEASAGPRGERGAKWRPAARIVLGADFLQRNATLKTSTAGVTPPCYCGTSKDANPFFPAFTMQAELFPFAFNGTGDSYLEGLGLHVDGFVTEVKSFVNNSQGATINSTLVNFQGGPTYRLVWWNSPTAIDSQFTLGYSVFTFPLATGAFPGVSYKAPYVGLDLHIPLGLEQLALVANFDYKFAVGVGDTASTQLGNVTGASGFDVGGGLRFSFDRFEISTLVKYSAYNVSYGGQSNLSNVSTQLSNVGLSDHMLQIFLTGGVVF